MSRLFGNLKMKWINVIIFALVTGIYTGIVMLIPFLKGTSFQDIGISYEWWVVFAVIVTVNCSKSWEAALKCFVFFLISQPLVYLVEWVFGTPAFDAGMFELYSKYYLTIWLPITFLTLPGGFIAYFAKKQTVFGGIVMGLGNTIEVILGVFYLKEAIVNFPMHILSSLVCFAAVVIMTLSLQKEKRGRLIAFLIPLVLLIGVIIFAKVTGRTFI